MLALGCLTLLVTFAEAGISDTAMSSVDIHIIAGVIRRGKPDMKQAPPVCSYVRRYHVSKWRLCVLDRRNSETTLTLIHAVIPSDRFQHYSARVKVRIEGWIKSHEPNEPIATRSLASAFAQDLSDNKCPYFVNRKELPSDPVCTFGMCIVRYEEAHITWLWDSRKTKTKYTDTETAAEVARCRGLPVPVVERTPQTRQPDDREPHRSSRERVTSLDRFLASGRQLTFVTRETPPRLSADGPLEAARGSEEHTNGDVAAGSDGADLLTCFCCYEQKPMCLLSCGHICCSACIDQGVKVTKKRSCFVCKAEWTFCRAVDIRSVKPDIVCAECDERRVYIMICGHATCGCSTRVCPTCNTGPTVRVFM